jgi:hypothetical protein
MSARGAAPNGGGAVLDSRQWLLERYWIFAWGILVFASPLVLVLGGKRDLWGVGGYVAITLAARAVAWRAPSLGVLVHLHALFPYWAWYARLEAVCRASSAAGWANT